MVYEHFKLDFKPQRENLFSSEEKLPIARVFKVKTYLWFLFALLIFGLCIGISTFSLIMVNNLNKKVDHLKEQIQNLKSSLVSSIVHDTNKINHEVVYGKVITNTGTELPLHEYDDYSMDDNYFKNHHSSILKHSNEEEFNSNENNLKLSKQPPLMFLKVGEEPQRMKRSYVDSTTKTIQNSFNSNSTNFKKKNMIAEKHKNLKLQKGYKLYKGVKSSPKKRSVSTVDSSKDVSADFRRRPQHGRSWHSEEERTVRRNHPKLRNNVEMFDETVHTQRNKVLPSIHFDGDTSKYIMEKHANFSGNGHLCHGNQSYVDWVNPPWVNTLGMDEHFTLNHGHLKIMNSGLYLIYAQIFYVDAHDVNGYRVYKNSETLLQCTVTIQSTTDLKKGNTCYTAGVAHLIDGDEISVQDLAVDRCSVFEVGKSFFGVVKLGDIKNK